MTRPLRAEECTPKIDVSAIPEAVDPGSATDRMAPQSRAIDAIRNGLAIRAFGFNIAVVGPRGTGRTFAAVALAQERAQQMDTPGDLVLLPNPRGPLEPVPAFLPASQGPDFVRAMNDLYTRLAATLHDTLEGQGRNRIQLEIEREHSGAQRKIHRRLAKLANQYDLELVVNETGFELVPRTGEDESAASSRDQLPLPGLPEGVDSESSTDILDAIEAMTPHIEEVQRELALLESEAEHRFVQRQRETLRRNIDSSFANVPARALCTEQVAAHVRALHEYLVDYYHLQEGDLLPLPNLPIAAGLVVPTLLTSAHDGDKAPIVHAQSPTPAAMFGRMVTSPNNDSRYPDPGTILAGDLHRANGGFLIVDAESLIKHEHVYEHLKRCLMAGAILPREEGEEHALRPSSLPLDVKVVLIADPELIGQLQQLDPEFSRLFKIRAEFSEDMTWQDALFVYPRFAAWLQRHRGIPHCDRSAMAKLLRHASRLAEDQERITAELGRLADVLTEASHLARYPAELTAGHIDAALAAARERDGLLRDRILDLHRKGTLRVEVTGAHVGQVNGLAVVSDGFVEVGRPMRVTAVTYAGRGGPFNIEREVELSGPLHSKGVLILAGYLANSFARDEPLSFGASIVFEQTYTQIEGDSASMAELCSILSSLADTAIRQDIAVTGSVDQRGRALPVGGLNEKIEAFFDVCNHFGLTGKQGVMVPEHNVRNLVLREDVLTAIEGGQFNVWAFESVEQCIELLCGIPCGALACEDGHWRYPAATLYGRIQTRLDQLRERQRELRHHDGED